MSGYTDDGLVGDRVLEEGKTFVEKPFRRRELLDMVRDAMSRSVALDEGSR